MSPASHQTPPDPPRAAAVMDPPVIAPGHTFGTITDKISAIVLTRRTPTGWFVGLLISFAVMMLFLTAATWLLIKGTGIWGINIPVGWGFAIVNFVWWIGIGHAGTLISAILLLLHQRWRTSINRFAEAMTLFAVMCAGLFPVLHTGRPWLAYWMLPYPNSMGVWPQFRSPLIWDVFAVTTYATVSFLFWFVGLIPDLGTLRDRARSPVGRTIYGILAMGWRGSARHWARYEAAY
ncbi:MAG: hydrogenase, partial [Acidobacteria bacterium]